MHQENGNKSDVRWIKITDDAATGLKITGTPLMEVNVQDYSQQALYLAKPSRKLFRGDKTYVNIDLKQMGLGGDDSWSPRVHEEYQLKENAAKKHTNFYRKTISQLLFYDKKFTQNDMFFSILPDNRKIAC
jgi:hypothetical protein